MRNVIHAVCVAVVVVAQVATAGAEDPYEVAWKTQIGTSDSDISRSVTVDAFGNAYISGYTAGDLGEPNIGGHDAFVSKFDLGGNAVWTTHVGTTSDDESHAVAVDASGNVYISGYTEGDLDGSNAGGDDAFLSKFDSGGNEIWSTQIGTSVKDYSHCVTVDTSGNAYITGMTRGDLGRSHVATYDAFLSKFDSGGNEVWTTQIGTYHNDSGESVSVDAWGNVYISGYTGSNLGYATKQNRKLMRRNPWRHDSQIHVEV